MPLLAPSGLPKFQICLDRTKEAPGIQGNAQGLLARAKLASRNCNHTGKILYSLVTYPNPSCATPGGEGQGCIARVFLAGLKARFKRYRTVVQTEQAVLTLGGEYGQEDFPS